MYEDLVASVRQSTEAAVRESQERIDLAVDKSQQADRQAADATKNIGERWADRINAMRRRAADRAQGKSKEMDFGHEDGPHPADTTENDELVSLTDQPTAPSAALPSAALPGADDKTPPYGLPQQVPDTYGRHAQQSDAERFMSHLPPEENPEPRFTSPPTRRGAPPRRPRPRVDDDDDYSGQSWLEGR